MASQENPSAWNASLYDDKHRFVTQYGLGVMELLDPQPGERILDLGCGTGHLTQTLADKGALPIGVDASPEMIAKARAEYPHLSFEVLDARAVNFESEFDAVFTNATLHWIPDAAAVARGVFRALQPGGRYVGEFGGDRNIQGIVDAVLEAAHRAGFSDPGTRWYYPSLADYAQTLAEAGLEAQTLLLFDRPTPLDGENGLKNWLEQFGKGFSFELTPEIVEIAIEIAHPSLCREGVWTADYRRLRFVAVKP